MRMGDWEGTNCSCSYEDGGLGGDLTSREAYGLSLSKPGTDYIEEAII
jgi:hypothetical protein